LVETAVCQIYILCVLFAQEPEGLDHFVSVINEAEDVEHLVFADTRIYLLDDLLLLFLLLLFLLLLFALLVLVSLHEVALAFSWHFYYFLL